MTINLLYLLFCYCVLKKNITVSEKKNITVS